MKRMQLPVQASAALRHTRVQALPCQSPLWAHPQLHTFGYGALLVSVLWLLAGCALGPAAPTPGATAPAIEPPAAAAPTAIVMETPPPVVVVTATVVVTVTEMVTTPVLETAAPESTTPTVTAVVSDDKPITAIVVGVNADLDPFETVDANGNIVGFDIDLMNALAQAAAIEVSFVDMDFDALIPAVANGEVDAAISAITPTAERAALVAFTDAYFSSEQSPVSYFGGGLGLAVRTETTYLQSTDDLTDTVTVGVKSGTTGDTYVVEKSNAQIVRYNEAPEALTALANGDVDAVVTDISVIAEYVTDHPGVNVQLMGKPLTHEEYAIALALDRVDLLQLLNAALIKVRADGDYDAIFEKWFTLP